MKVVGKFIFREFKHRKAGSFKKEDEIISFDEAYILKIDYIATEGDLFEGEFKIGVSETELIKALSQYKTYDEIKLSFEILRLWKDNIKIKIIEVVADNNGENADKECQKKLF